MEYIDLNSKYRENTVAGCAPKRFFSALALDYSLQSNGLLTQGCQQTQIWNPENATPGVKGAAEAPFVGPGQRPGGGQGAKPPEAPRL